MQVFYNIFAERCIFGNFFLSKRKRFVVICNLVNFTQFFAAY